MKRAVFLDRDGVLVRATPFADYAHGPLTLDDFAILPGHEESFTAAFREAVVQLQGSRGFRSARLTRGIESPARFVLLVEWEDLEAHTVGFRGSERFTRWREIIGPFFDGPPKM